MSDKEFRSSAELNYREDNEKLILEGYAVIFDSETLIGNEERGYYEVIDRNAIDASALKDVPLKYNHDSGSLILARTRNKSLELKLDEKGLFIHAELQSNITQHRDAYNAVQSGLIDKMSFAFSVTDHVVDRTTGKLPKRRITKIGKLFDVSVVDIPAYDDTSVYARSLDLVDAELRALDDESKEQSLDKDDVELEKLKWKIKLSL